MNSDEKTNGSSPSSDLRSNGIFLFAYDVDEESTADAIEFILEANLEPHPDYDHLTLIINSHGGSVVDGFALLDVMSGSKIPVWTVGIGILASMGLIIFMGGVKGHRVLTPNTMILSHQWWSFAAGKEHELLASRKKNELITEKILRHYKRCSNFKKEKDIREILLPPHDVWLTAEEALKYGLCDEVKYI